jgi:hypothetical protein
VPYLDFAPDAGQRRWLGVLTADPDEAEVRDLWCQAVIGALRLTRTGVEPDGQAADLVQPFLAHAEYRRRLYRDLDRSEAYVAELANCMAALLT